MTNQSFSKEERLSRRKLIEALFREGSSIRSGPITLVYKFMELPTDLPVQAAVTVSKRRFKRAVDRNRIKRLMREAYRKNKMPIYELLKSEGKQCCIMWIYNGKELPHFPNIEQRIIDCLSRFTEEHS